MRVLLIRQSGSPCRQHIHDAWCGSVAGLSASQPQGLERQQGTKSLPSPCADGQVQGRARAVQVGSGLVRGSAGIHLVGHGRGIDLRAAQEAVYWVEDVRVQSGPPRVRGTAAPSNQPALLPCSRSRLLGTRSWGRGGPGVGWRKGAWSRGRGRARGKVSRNVGRRVER